MAQSFENKFVAYVDILGFKSAVANAEAGKINLADLLDAVQALRGPQSKWKTFSPTICPSSVKKSEDVGFRLTQVSDGVVISAETTAAGAINLIYYCWAIALNLLRKGFMCRGFITQGHLFHDEQQILGSGYINAYNGEQNVTVFQTEADERGTPFIQIDEEVCNFALSADGCTRQMFKRMTKMDGKIAAIFPFSTLEHSFLISKDIDVKREKTSNANVRKWIEDMKIALEKFVDRENPSAVAKVSHYMKALEDQLRSCDSLDSMLDNVGRPTGLRYPLF